MSKYAINKFMRLVNMHPDALAEYCADPPSFAQAFSEDLQPQGFERVPRGALLDDEELDALRARDYVTLYRLGAHPYLLWSFTEAVWVPEVTRQALVEAFRDGAKECGYPDFATTECSTASEGSVHD